MSLMRQTFDLIGVAGHRFVFTGCGDSTFNRGNGIGGEWGCFLDVARNWAPCLGGLGGMNYSGAGQNYLHAIRRNSATAVGATTAPPAACNGGIVCPSGWTGFQHALLATAGTTIAATHWNWTLNALFANAHGRVVASVFAMDLAGAADANTGYIPVISGGSTLDVSASQSGTRQAAGTRVSSSRTITGISVHATAPVITTSAAHGFETGQTVTLASTNSTPAVNGAYVITVTSPTTFTIPATTTNVGTAGFANCAELEGTLRRYDMESEMVTPTAASGAGATACIGDGSTRFGGPLLALYCAITCKDTQRGWYASKHISQGGKSVFSCIKDHLNTSGMRGSVENYFACMVLLNDTTYAQSYGGCQGDATPGGLGGADLPIGCLWLSCFGHNDVGSDANVSSFVPDGSPAWAVESAGTIASVNTGAGTVTLTDATAFDTAGHIHVNDGEIITYTGKSTHTLTGCTFAAYGSSAGARTGAVVQGHLGITPAGFAANMVYWDQWLRARWAAAGGTPALFRHFWKAPHPVHESLEIVSGVASGNLAQREQRLREFVSAVNARMTSAYFEVIDPRDTITAKQVLENRWCDVNGVATLSASGVTSTAGDTINCGTGLGSNGIGRIGAEIFTWTGKSGNNPTGCTRGAFGSTAYDASTPSHTSGREVVDCDMVHNSTQGYRDFWRLHLERVLPRRTFFGRMVF